MTSSSYLIAIAHVLASEGGYVNHKDDPGGPTNFGITLADARHYWKADATAADVRSMSLDIAKQIYRAHYWNVMSCDALPAGVDYCVFDYGVNSGVGRSASILQKLLKVPRDGVIGPQTIAAANEADPASLVEAICNERMAFLKSLRIWRTFGRGWSARVAEVRATSLRLAAAAPHGKGKAAA
jgi:lysozyme family protein